MNSIQAATAEAFVEILRDSGIPVTIGGIEIKATLSTGGMEIDLEEGGFSKGGSVTVKVIVRHLAAMPALNDIILIDGERPILRFPCSFLEFLFRCPSPVFSEASVLQLAA